ncbi:MAG: 2-keto-4-pentenoate hydratase [Dehalococcoidia bacterium]|jgi:2-oxopent-4-enoate hydratase|nr:2-keto-4-pentenoate hydratase [Dehalococcoidia bacterium]
MSLTGKQIEQVALELVEAARTHTPIVPLSERFGEVSYEDAYAIQLKTYDIKTKAGIVIVGKKIGFTSKAMQVQFNMTEPDYGMIDNTMVAREGQPIPMSSLILPKIEPEIAFLLKDDLVGPGINAAKVLAATEGVLPALEVVDSRYRTWTSNIKDSISDDASAGVFILGGRLTPVQDLDMRLIGMVFERNGSVVSTGAGAAVLGNPAESVAWLANKLTQYGIGLKKGEFVMSGSLVPAQEVKAGWSFRATFDRIGTVAALFE